MKTFWDKRYRSEAFIYGEAPNAFFASKINLLAPGKLLLPAEGEGRNAVFAAKLGWDVSAFDWSEEGRKKAERLAEKEKVTIEYLVSDLEHVEYKKGSFDLLGLFFAHFPEKVRHGYHQKLSAFVKPGGKLIVEGFAKAHIALSRANPKAGGPRDEGMLFSLEIIREDFPEFQWELLEEVTDFLNEGTFHVGESALIRAVGTKVDRDK